MTRLLALLASALVAGASAPAAGAESGRISVGISPGTSSDEVVAAVEQATGGTVAHDLGPLDALVVDVPDVDSALAAAEGVTGAEYAEPAAGTRFLSFAPNDPLFASQWYLHTVRAFDHWAEQPPLAPVLVAVVDSGIDAGHPEFSGRIAATRSFVSTAATTDSFGHGTIVAGEIAAGLGNATGIAGLGFPVKLLVAKIVARDGSISVDAEARAIRWAADQHASVINLSLGGPRDPRNPARDTYSALEHSAIDYATRKGAVVVAAAGNCARAVCPEPYANWPAALPHVIGVSATRPDGGTPAWSNRDAVNNDIAAPGVAILSTLPSRLSDSSCSPHGYTACAREEDLRHPRGTSFSAPLVSATAALLVAQRSSLGLPIHSSQVTAVVERSATDIGSGGRDRASGNGLLNVDAAVAALGAPLPPRDRYEPNDDAGSRARAVHGTSRRLSATLDRYDDVRDVYRIFLRRGERAAFRLAGPPGSNTKLFLWRPGTRRVTGPARATAVFVAASRRPGAAQRIVYRARSRGWYFLEALLASRRGGAYTLSVQKG